MVRKACAFQHFPNNGLSWDAEPEINWTLVLQIGVLQGIVTGYVEGSAEPSTPSANIMNSQLYKLALGE